MPNNLVKGTREERLWARAEELAGFQGHAKNHAYVVAIYKRLNPQRFIKAPTAKDRQLHLDLVTPEKR